MSESEVLDETPSVLDYIGKLKTVHKVAGVLFVLGKVSTFITGGLILVSPKMFLTSLIITCLLIGSCVLLCIAEMTRKHFDVGSKIERLEKELEELRKIKNEG